MSSSSRDFSRRRKSYARRIERLCCGALTYFPLAFVYSLITWAAWVQISIGFWPNEGKWTGKGTSLIGVVLYSLAVSCYSIAVFKDPGSPTNSPAAGGYASLPTHESPTYTSLTAKSSGKPRYCKKCNSIKPDRTHHCSSCNRCVLKMDHHCPYLATCVGMYNYKAFLLFLSYTSLFCWLCFATATEFVWRDIFDETKIEEGLRIVNVILLAVLGGIIGLVLTGFTAWHIYLATTGKTTIESLEKTRYFSPLKKSMERQIHNHERHYMHDDPSDELPLGEQLKEIHANFVPGVTRPEEGEESRNPTPLPTQNSSFESPASDSLRRNYASLEADRERERYTEYLDEQDSDKLPHAFDLGWRRNLLDLFGPTPWLWFFPVCNTEGDGWRWEVSAHWIARRDEVARDRAVREENERRSWRDYQAQRAQWGAGALGAGRYFGGPPPAQQHQQHQLHQQPQRTQQHLQPTWTDEQEDEEEATYLTTTNGVARVPLAGRRSPSKAAQILGQYQQPGRGPPIRRKTDPDDIDDYDTSSDDEGSRPSSRPLPQTRDWNDIPDDFLTSATSKPKRDRSGNRTKGD
ncbi:zf-DHHC-domain-containing protein [Aureobasidium pullulans]|uniref:Palmitoyltransferase n=1 Tax=Aureobasidium pullulans TaxID=5580 RepID=A0A4S9V6P4_AURPU|nr:zf-DHHC-domain-containing protein [Aureobasidium pullulans]